MFSTDLDSELIQASSLATIRRVGWLVQNVNQYIFYKGILKHVDIV